MNMRRLIPGILVAALATAALGYASRAPYTAPGSDTAMLRLSWRLRGEKQQNCRKRSEAELAELPVHMRTPLICTGHLVAYQLKLEIDDEVVDTLTIAPAGAKGDRPIFVLHDVVLTSGWHDVELEFAPQQGKGQVLRFEGEIEASPGRIELITLAADGNLSHQRSGRRE